jgi:hypothetical protein
MEICETWVYWQPAHTQNDEVNRELASSAELVTVWTLADRVYRPRPPTL